jgi:hypothetical protein
MLTKVCTKCGVEKTVDCFNKSSKGKFGTNSACKQCIAKYQQDNKASISSYQKQWKQLHKEAVSSDGKRYRQQNKEAVAFRQKQYVQKNKESIASRKKIWRQSNSDRVNATNSNRRALKIRATPSWVDHEAIVGMYRLSALFNSAGIFMHVDHIVPLISDFVCGLHCEANLQLLPASDNISKGNRHWPDMW